MTEQTPEKPSIAEHQVGAPHVSPPVDLGEERDRLDWIENHQKPNASQRLGRAALLLFLGGVLLLICTLLATLLHRTR